LSSDLIYAGSQDLLKQKSVTTVTNLSDLSTYQNQFHVVKAGDTLSRIASEYGLNIDTIMWANNLSDGDFIQPGMKLIIPPGDGVRVTVKKGDSLNSIAKKYKSNAQAILDYPTNAFLISPADITPGMVLFVPDGVQIQAPVVAAKPSYTNVIITKPYQNASINPGSSSVGRFLRWPVAGGKGMLTQCYWAGHNGIDIADSSLPGLVAAASGTVTFAGCQSGNCPPAGQLYGGSGLAWTVIIDHGNGFQTVYGHMNSIYVKSGQKVSAGQSIGKMGASGRVTGVHVHFMVLSGGGWNSVNPAAYMSRSICGY